MSARDTYAGQRPMSRASQRAITPPVFYQLAASASPPQALKRSPSVARSARKNDRALFSAIRFALKPAQIRETLLNVLLVGGAIGMIITVAAALLIAPYILFSVET